MAEDWKTEESNTAGDVDFQDQWEGFEKQAEVKDPSAGIRGNPE